MKPAQPDRLIFVGVIALLLWLPLPWGSHRPWAEGLFTAGVGLLLAGWFLLATIGRTRWPQLPGLWIPLLLWIGWLGWIALQLVPLGADTLQAWSPRSAATHSALATHAGATPLYTLSIAPGNTADALLLSAGYFGLYLLVLVTCAGHAARLSTLLLALVVSGFAQALYGGLMTLSGLEYGFFAEKIHYRDVATGTFVNRNHLAGYLGLTLSAGVGLLLSQLEPPRGRQDWRKRLLGFVDTALSPKVRIRIILSVMVIALVLTRSRMGNTAFFVALCVCGLGYVLVRERWLAWRAGVLLLSLLLIDSFIVSRWFGLEQVVQRIEQTDVQREGRAQLLLDIPPVIDSYCTTGAGLGTFDFAYSPARSLAMRQYFDHAHNDYVEFAVEVGLPGLVLLALLAGVHAAHAGMVILRRRRRLPAAVAFAALMALLAQAIHAAVDFNLQIPATAATLVTLLAAVAACSSRSSSKKRMQDIARIPAEDGLRRAPAGVD